jgi:hypothetical protein
LKLDEWRVWWADDSWGMMNTETAIRWKIHREHIFGFISSTFEMPPRSNVQPHRERLPPDQIPHMITPSDVQALKRHFDAGCEKLIQDTRQQQRPLYTMLLILDEAKAEVAALAATVTEMRDTIKSLSA